ncbi:transporter substrate-binding domain-containing protein (plasmid) [Pseudoalteromonas xiamenensis]|uniref:substrate-binding periplasmic protein n=1 Tax=Pseudoalteromonas xiamenensis TaxID=882626 RepID=UPI0027E475F7|nr:transporter substrate-binding domain-containing protein [Pseudoalteromonas xiamenensis]WMN61776.1 transporter substrate-binding domain-containing protein [Pseudoalteromonas xiamenensis]
MITRKFSWLISVLCILFIVPTYALEPCVRTVKLGLASDWPPLVIFKGPHTTGLEIEIAKQVFSEIGICINFVRLPSSSRSFTELQKGNIDFVLMASFTKERAKFGHFSAPYRQERMRLFGKIKGNLLTTLAQVFDRGESIAVSTGSYYGEEFEHLRATAENQKQIVEVANATRRARLLAMGRVDYVIEDEISGGALLKKYQIEDGVMLPYPVHDNNVHYLLRKEVFTAQDISNLNAAIVRNKAFINELIQAYSQPSQSH